MPHPSSWYLLLSWANEEVFLVVDVSLSENLPGEIYCTYDDDRLCLKPSVGSATKVLIKFSFINLFRSSTTGALTKNPVKENCNLNTITLIQVFETATRDSSPIHKVQKVGSTVSK